MLTLSYTLVVSRKLIYLLELQCKTSQIYENTRLLLKDFSSFLILPAVMYCAQPVCVQYDISPAATRSRRVNSKRYGARSLICHTKIWLATSVLQYVYYLMLLANTNI